MKHLYCCIFSLWICSQLGECSLISRLFSSGQNIAKVIPVDSEPNGDQTMEKFPRARTASVHVINNGQSSSAEDLLPLGLEMSVIDPKQNFAALEPEMCLMNQAKAVELADSIIRRDGMSDIF